MRKVFPLSNWIETLLKEIYRIGIKFLNGFSSIVFNFQFRKLNIAFQNTSLFDDFTLFFSRQLTFIKLSDLVKQKQQNYNLQKRGWTTLECL